MEHLYVCHFSNGHIKVGRSIDPQSRIATHADRVACMGVELVEHAVFECNNHSAPAEMVLIQLCDSQATKRNRSEWFEGCDYLEVCDWAAECASKYYPPAVEIVSNLAVAPVRAFLERLGHAQVQQLSTDSGVPFTTLWKIRDGKTTNPGLETVRKFYPATPKEAA